MSEKIEIWVWQFDDGSLGEEHFNSRSSCALYMDGADNGKPISFVHTP